MILFRVKHAFELLPEALYLAVAKRAGHVFEETAFHFCTVILSAFLTNAVLFHPIRMIVFDEINDVLFRVLLEQDHIALDLLLTDTTFVTHGNFLHSTQILHWNEDTAYTPTTKCCDAKGGFNPDKHDQISARFDQSAPAFWQGRILPEHSYCKIRVKVSVRELLHNFVSYKEKAKAGERIVVCEHQ